MAIMKNGPGSRGELIAAAFFQALIKMTRLAGLAGCPNSRNLIISARRAADALRPTHLFQISRTLLFGVEPLVQKHTNVDGTHLLFPPNRSYQRRCALWVNN